MSGFGSFRNPLRPLQIRPSRITESWLRQLRRDFQFPCPRRSQYVRWQIASRTTHPSELLSFRAIYIAEHNPVKQKQLRLAQSFPCATDQMFDTQESMDSNHHIAARVRELLDSKGVPKHRHVATAADLLGLSASHAHRKMKGDSQWTLEQVKKIATAFNVDPLTLIEDQIGDESHDGHEVSAQLKIGETTVPCRAVLHNAPVMAKQAYNTTFFAEKRPPEWLIQYSDIPLVGAYPVLRINIECESRRRPTRVVAILEDNLETAAELSAFLKNHNYETVAFQSIDELNVALKSQHLDAFILDWILDGTITAPAVELIRQHFGDDVPILILTGYAKNPVHLEQIAAAMLRYNIIGPYEKPIKGPLIKAALDIRFLHGSSDAQESS